LLFVSATYKAFAAGCACASFKASGDRIEGIPSQEIIQIGLTMVHSKVGMHPSARSALPTKTVSYRMAKADPGPRGAYA